MRGLGSGSGGVLASWPDGGNEGLTPGRCGGGGAPCAWARRRCVGLPAPAMAGRGAARTGGGDIMGRRISATPPSTPSTATHPSPLSTVMSPSPPSSSGGADRATIEWIRPPEAAGARIRSPLRRIRPPEVAGEQYDDAWYRARWAFFNSLKLLTVAGDITQLPRLIALTNRGLNRDGCKNRLS
jgi:hypothetical protein